VQVLGGGSAVSSAHVRSLTSGLVARGVRVTVCAPHETDGVHDFTGVGARHIHVPRSSDPASVATLRNACADADLVHAHGLHAGFRATLALSGRPTPLVVTWHTRSYAEGARAHLLRLLERRVAKAAAVVLGTSSELVDRARSRGARDARLAAVSVPALRRNGDDDTDRHRSKTRAELGATDRPLLMAAGALDRHRGYDTLLDAAREWRGLDPDLALLPGGPEARSVLAQEALHARVPLVAAFAGSVPELVGDAAALVPFGNAGAFAETVARLLKDPALQDELRDRGTRQAATWPTEDETVAQVLSVYDELTDLRPLM
jgi:glycosyltransferase involved in cell wall biosynthesis